MALVAGVYIMGRAGWLQMTHTAGAVLPPLVHEYGTWFLSAAGAGLILAPFITRTRSTLFMLAGIVLQAGTFYLQARADGNPSAYLAFKTFYLAPYPLAVLAVLPAAVVWKVARIPTRAAITQFVAWTLVALVSYKALRPIVTARRETPAISEPLFLAAQWGAGTRADGLCCVYGGRRRHRVLAAPGHAAETDGCRRGAAITTPTTWAKR